MATRRRFLEATLTAGIAAAILPASRLAGRRTDAAPAAPADSADAARAADAHALFRRLRARAAAQMAPRFE